MKAIATTVVVWCLISVISLTDAGAAFPTSGSSSATNSKLQRFLHPSASIVDISSTERGIRVDKPLKRNDILLSVPLEHVITPERGYDTPVGRRILLLSPENNISIDDQTFLALWLCHVTAEHSRTGNLDAADDTDITNSYLATLPRLEEMRHLPVFWSDEDISELDGSQVKLDILAKRIKWRMLYEKISAMDPDGFGEQTSLDRFLWSKAVVESRSFRLREVYLESEEEQAIKRKIALVPLADMLNHRSRSDPMNTCDWRVERENGGAPAFVIRVDARDGLCPGSEACHSYGLCSNSHYLLQYGFAVECNQRHDGASPDTAHIQVSLKGVRLRYFAVTIGDKKLAKSLLSALRISVATDREKLQTNSWDAPFSVENERAAIKQLKQSIDQAIRRYPTTLEEDLYLLEQAPAGTNRRNAILVRSGEKIVLRHWLFLCEASLFFLDDVADGTKQWSDYCDVLETTLGRVKSIAP